MKRLNKSEQRFYDLARKYEELEKRVEEEIKKSHQKDLLLIRQSRLASIGELVANIGHQWKNPLNHLSLLIQDVKDELEFGVINDQYIERFTKESMAQIKHMSQTIDDFRKFYRSTKEVTLFSLEESIEDALTIFSPTIKDQNIHVEFEYREKHMGFGLQNEFSQVVLNLLANAKDMFMERQIQSRSITIQIMQNETFLVSSFTDNAGGIEKDYFTKVFEPYFTTRNDGSGLGLYLAKMIMEKMNGWIEVENTVNGARFSLFVPKLIENENRPSLSV